MFTHAHLYNPNMWLIIVGISRKVETLFTVSVLFLSPVMSRNSNRNKNSTHSVRSNNPVNEPSFVFANEASKVVFQALSQP